MTANELLTRLNKSYSLWTDEQLSAIDAALQNGGLNDETTPVLDAGLGKLATRDYLTQDPAYVQSQKEKRQQFAKSVHEGYKGFGHSKFKELFGGENGLFGDDDLQALFFADKSKNTKDVYADAFNKVKLGYETAIQKAREEAAKGTGDEAKIKYEEAIGKKDEAIREIQATIETLKTQHATAIQQAQRDGEMEIIKYQLAQQVAGLPLANKEQLPLAIQAVQNALLPNYVLRSKDGKIQAYDKQNPEVLANHPTEKVTLDVAAYAKEILEGFKLLSANNGGGNPANPVRTTGGNPPGRNDTPTFTTEFTLPEGVDPNSDYARRMKTYWESQNPEASKLRK